MLESSISGRDEFLYLKRVLVTESQFHIDDTKRPESGLWPFYFTERFISLV